MPCTGSGGPACPERRNDPPCRFRPPIHAIAQDRQRGGQEGQAIEHGNRDHDRAGRAHRGHESALEEQHRGQADRDRDAGKRDRAARGGHGDGDRILASGSARELVTESVDDEQRIVDGDSKADQGHDVGRVLRNVCEMGEEHRARQPADDRQQSYTERQQRGDDRGKDEDQHEKRDWKGNVFGTLQVGVERRVERKVERNLARGDDGKGPGTDSGHHLVDIFLGLTGLVLEFHDDQSLVPVARDETGLLARRHAVGRRHTEHPWVALQGRERGLES